MNIYISMKSIGKRKNVISKQGAQLPSTPGSLRVLLSELVTLNVQRLAERDKEIHLVKYLTETEIKHQAFNGKVGFGNINNEQEPDLTESIQTATQAFEYNLFLVFVNSELVEALDTPL